MRLEFRARARDDLARIYDFNAERSERWAERVENRLLERAQSLTTVPHAGRETQEPGVRRLSIPDIQYAMDYQLADDLVEILQILSTREIG